MITHDQLIFAIQQDYPNLAHSVDYWVGQEMDGDVQVTEARIYQWNPESIPEPDHDAIIARATALLPEYEAAQAAIIPQIVTAAQGGIALIQADLMNAVLTAVNDPETPAEVKWAWEKAQNWERSSPALNYLADKAGITQPQMDELFVAAAKIQA